MPDRLDDVEGFYGLDEIDGVNIEIDGGGRAEYKVCSSDWRAGGGGGKVDADESFRSMVRRGLARVLERTRRGGRG